MTSSYSAQNFSSPEYKMAIWTLTTAIEAFLMDLQKKMKKKVSTMKIVFNEHIVYFCIMASSSSAPNFSSPKYKIAIVTLTTAI